MKIATTDLFQELWKQYVKKTPSALKVKKMFEEKGETVQNDHIAIRTFNDPRVGIDVLAQPFLAIGYVPKGEYHFKKKKLYAKHFEHQTDAYAPKIFISELLVEKFSEELQKHVHLILDEVDPQLFEDEKLILKGRVWATPSLQVYEKLLQESEYAAWMYVNGFCSNHFTININSLKSFKSLQEVNDFLKSNDFKMNSSGGEIKGSPSLLLEQSSILADTVTVKFKESVKEITSCYYEFAFRYKKPDGTLFNGFIADSADKIFESTDMKSR
ncbi:DUF1338 domain-containing protein [Aquimarina sp. U1-2]|uniref:DUF1338 domain-containing protein n=1 Tax=Aquimarina sp. U1-2 TaxID=2823141 RepID=UPI001AECC482|nr:DUF1338 domain-containing protein [Aquimarina sp. U1-2]MBP2833560.1 DUF1338 domain-containing protein [Aquimarina sp. U1-2]